MYILVLLSYSGHIDIFNNFYHHYGSMKTAFLKYTMKFSL